MKTFKLLKAVMSQDMNLFKKNSDGSKKGLGLSIALFCIISLCIGFYYYDFAESVKEYNLTFLVLTFGVIACILISFLEGIYKAAAMLFDSKDSELLFSLPISRKSILFVRFVKVFVFQLLFSAMFFLPGIVVYAIFENPGISYYFYSLLMLILTPLIPTIIACIIGYVIKSISSNLKFKRAAQVLFSLTVLFGYFGVMLNSNKVLEYVIKNAYDINDVIRKIFYPLAAYLDLIYKFDLLKLIGLLAFNLIPLVLFVVIASKNYFKIYSKSKNNAIEGKKLESYNFKRDSVIKALTKKELSKYFSLPSYVFNTIFGMILFVGIGVVFGINLDKSVDEIVKAVDIVGTEESVKNLMPVVFVSILILMNFTTNITSASISLEGGCFNTLKTLPIKMRDVLKAKILMSLIITLPFMLVGIIAFSITNFYGFVFLILCILFAISTSLFTAIVGLNVNISNPKLKFSNEIEVIKQGTSTMICTFTGLIVSMLLITTTIVMALYIPANLALLLELVVLILIDVIGYILLMTSGVKKLNKLTY